MKVVIIGGGAAGMACASRVKALKPEWDVKVFEATSFVSHAPCGIPYAIEFGFGSEKLIYYKPEVFIEKRGIDLHMNSKVVELEYGKVRVEENGRERSYDWDKLLIATGASPKLPKIEGIDLDNILTVDLPPDVEKISKVSKKAEDIVIVGAGYIGIEMAEAFSTIGKKVTVVEMEDKPLPQYDKEITDIIKREMEKYVNLRLNERIVSFEGRDAVRRVITDKGEYPADLVIVAVGVKPNVELAKMLDVELGITGAIKTDERMRTNVENVYSAGDCAETKHIVTGKPVWSPLAPPSNKMGYVAGANMAGIDIKFPGVLGTQLTKFHNLQIAKTGLTEKEAIEEGYDIVKAFIEANTKVHYYPTSKKIYIKTIAEKNKKKLLGAQVVGYDDVAMRVNIFATAIQAGFTTKDLFFTDLGYAPPFTPIWDPVIVSARVLRF